RGTIPAEARRIRSNGARQLAVQREYRAEADGDCPPFGPFKPFTWERFAAELWHLIRAHQSPRIQTARQHQRRHDQSQVATQGCGGVAWRSVAEIAQVCQTEPARRECTAQGRTSTPAQLRR